MDHRGPVVFPNVSQVPCTDSRANETPSPSWSITFAHQIICPRVANVVVVAGIGAQHGVSGSVLSRGFPRFPLQGFLGQTFAFLFFVLIIDFLIEATRSLGVPLGSGPGSSEKGNSLANSSVLASGVNLSLFLALGVKLGLGGTGGFLPGLADPLGEAGSLFHTLGRLDQLRQPSLHGPSIKIVLAG